MSAVRGPGGGPPASSPARTMLGGLFGTLTSDLSELVRSEMELARRDPRGGGQGRTAAGMLGAGGLILSRLGLLAMAAAWGWPRLSTPVGPS